MNRSVLSSLFPHIKYIPEFIVEASLQRDVDVNDFTSTAEVLEVQDCIH